MSFGPRTTRRFLDCVICNTSMLPKEAGIKVKKDKKEIYICRDCVAKAYGKFKHKLR